MRIRSVGAVPLIGALFILSGTFNIQQVAAANTAKSPTSSEACRDFVQRFYDWYENAKPKGNRAKSDYALKSRAAMFTPVLKQKLEEDEKASEKSPGEIVGLDFDPFQNAQDDPGRMVAEKATMKGSNCMVDVYRSPHDAKAKPDVTPELTLKNGQWVFINFHYPPSDTPGNNDLLSILKGLAADRAKHH